MPCARDDLEVDLDGDLPGVHAEFPQEVCYGGDVFHAARVAVDNQVHGAEYSPQGAGLARFRGRCRTRDDGPRIGYHAAMRPWIASQIERFPIHDGRPEEAWDAHVREVVAGVVDRLDQRVPRRAHHAGRGRRFWLPALHARFPAARHLIARGWNGLPDDAEPPLAAGEAGVAVGDPCATLRALPPASLDLATAWWPPDVPASRGAPGALQSWMTAARHALAPGREVAVCVARDGSPETPLRALREVLQDLRPDRLVREGGLPGDEDDLRERLRAAGFGNSRAWRAGLSLAFPSGAVAVEHFLDRGGDVLVPRTDVAVRDALAACLDQWFAPAGPVALTFETVCALARVPEGES